MNKFFAHIRSCIFRGLWAVVPLGLCILVVELLYHFTDRRIMAAVQGSFDVRDFPGEGILLLMCFLYVLGLLAGNVVGHWFLGVIHAVTNRIPLIKHIYSVSRQIGEALISTDGNVFKKTVLLNYPNPSQWTIGFLTGSVRNEATGEDLLKVYVPMCHPVIGFVYLARESQVIEPGWPPHETFKMMVSVGIITPRRG